MSFISNHSCLCMKWCVFNKGCDVLRHLIKRIWFLFHYIIEHQWFDDCDFTHLKKSQEQNYGTFATCHINRVYLSRSGFFNLFLIPMQKENHSWHSTHQKHCSVPPYQHSYSWWFISYIMSQCFYSPHHEMILVDDELSLLIWVELFPVCTCCCFMLFSFFF